VVELVPFDVQFLAGAVSATDDPPLDGNEGSFAILDSEQASVTGVAAATVDRDTDRCVVSVHAMG